MSNPAVFPPSSEFIHNANVQGMEGYLDLYRRAEQDPEQFWADIASKEVHWFEKWSKVLDWEAPFAK